MFLQLLHVVRKEAENNNDVIISNDSNINININKMDGGHPIHGGERNADAQSNSGTGLGNSSAPITEDTIRSGNHNSEAAAASNTGSPAMSGSANDSTTAGGTPDNGEAKASQGQMVSSGESSVPSGCGKTGRRVRVKKPVMSNRWRDFYLEVSDDSTPTTPSAASNTSSTPASSLSTEHSVKEKE